MTDELKRKKRFRIEVPEYTKDFYNHDWSTK